MKVLGNILWFLLAGWILGLSWLSVGLVWCITIVGIPVGVQCFKLAGLSFLPFGKEIVYQGGSASLLANILWILFGGLGLAIENALAGVFFCITIIGIPFGKQCFKLAKLSLTPFGAQVRPAVRNPQV